MSVHQTESQILNRETPANTLVDNFKTAFRNHPAGVAVITAQGYDRPVGLTASSVSSVSANPPLLVFSLSGSSWAAPDILESKSVLVHLLDAEQLEQAKIFATGGIDRFADISTWSRLATGEPILHGAGTWLRGEIINDLPAGDSTVVVVKVLEVGVPDQPVLEPEKTRPLVYHNRAWHSLSETSVLG